MFQLDCCVIGCEINYNKYGQNLLPKNIVPFNGLFKSENISCYIKIRRIQIRLGYSDGAS